MKTTHYFSFILFLFIFFGTSCHQDSDTLIDTQVIPENVVFIQSFFNGHVIDINGAGLQNATVKIGDTSSLTDKNGYFEMTPFVDSRGAYINISKDGYFDGLGNISLNTNKDHFVRIMLQQRIQAGSVSGTTGGSVAYQNHEVVFAPSSFKDQNGNDFSGDVSVYIAYIDPTANNFSELIPGDLVGVNENEERNILKSYGMLHVEITDTQGNELTLSNPAELKMEIPSSLLGDAPATIPMWHFNESTGIWNMEGEAEKNGDKYQAFVSHFSLWNCDIPASFLNLKVNFLSRSSLRNIPVRVTSEILDQTLSIQTNNDGSFAGKVPGDDNVLIEVLNSCDEVIYEELIQTPTDGQVTKTIQLDFTDLVTLRGIVTDCDGEPIPHAYVIIKNKSVNKGVYYQTNKDGYLETDFFKCSDDLEVTVVDLDNGRQSTVEFILVDNIINIGNLEACDDEIISKIVFEVSDNEVYTYYFVTAKLDNSGTDWDFVYNTSFPDGSSYQATHNLDLDGFVGPGWEVTTEFGNIVGSPTSAFQMRINNQLDFIEETNEYIEVEFPLAEIYNNVTNEYATYEGRIYIKAFKI